MANDRTVMMEWRYFTLCSKCGKDVVVADDASRGKTPFRDEARATCKACGHAGQYSPSVIQSKLTP